MNKHLEFLQWCIENSDENFNVNYSYSGGYSWISGTVMINCIKGGEVDAAIQQLEIMKREQTPKAAAKKRKAELLAELELVNATLAG